MTEDDIIKAAVHYANNLEDVKPTNGFSRNLCIALGQAFRDGAKWSYEQAMAELQEKIAQVKKNGTWDGVDVNEFIKEVRGE